MAAASNLRVKTLHGTSTCEWFSVCILTPHSLYKLKGVAIQA